LNTHIVGSSFFTVGIVSLGNLLYDLKGDLLEMRFGLPRCTDLFHHR